MKNLMLTFVFEKFKIFYSIVMLNFIYVMYAFFRVKVPAYMLFHNKAMFINISTFRCKGMSWFINQYITKTIKSSTTTPIRVIFSIYIFIPRLIREFLTFTPKPYYRIVAFFGTIFSFIFFVCLEYLTTFYTWFCQSFNLLFMYTKTFLRTKNAVISNYMIVTCFKFFFAYQAFSNQIITSSKKAAFSWSKRERLSPTHNLLTAHFGHRKSAISLTMLIISFLFILVNVSSAREQLVDFSENALPLLNNELEQIDKNINRAPKIYQGTAAPSTAPYKTGDMWVDTVNHKLYISDGTDSSTNWRILN